MRLCISGGRCFGAFLTFPFINPEYKTGLLIFLRFSKTSSISSAVSRWIPSVTFRGSGKLRLLVASAEEVLRSVIQTEFPSSASGAFEQNGGLRGRFEEPCLFGRPSAVFPPRVFFVARLAIAHFLFLFSTLLDFSIDSAGNAAAGQ